MMFGRGVRPCDVKAYEETDRLHTEADAAEKAGNHAAAAKLRAAARAKNDNTLEAQVAAKLTRDEKFSKRRRPKRTGCAARRRRTGRAAAEAKAAAAAAGPRTNRSGPKQAAMAAEAKAKADQAAAELLAAEEAAEASAAAAKKKKKKKKKKRGGGAAPMPAVDRRPLNLWPTQRRPPSRVAESRPSTSTTARRIVRRRNKRAAPPPRPRRARGTRLRARTDRRERAAVPHRRGSGRGGRGGRRRAEESSLQSAVPDAEPAILPRRSQPRGGYSGAGVQADTGAALLPHLSRVDGTARDSGGRAHV